MKLVTDLVKQDTVTDAEIKECAYGIAYHGGDGLNEQEWDRLTAMRTRLSEIEAMEKTALRARRAGQDVKMVMADCGHYTIEVMNASTGTCCPNCYDRMSD